MIYILIVHLKFSRTLILLWSKAFCRSINILIHTVFIQYSWLYDNMINILTVNSSNYTNKSTYIKSVLFLLILFQREAAKRPTPPPPELNARWNFRTLEKRPQKAPGSGNNDWTNWKKRPQKVPETLEKGPKVKILRLVF